MRNLNFNHLVQFWWKTVSQQTISREQIYEDCFVTGKSNFSQGTNFLFPHWISLIIKNFSPRISQNLLPLNAEFCLLFSGTTLNNSTSFSTYLKAILYHVIIINPHSLPSGFLFSKLNIWEIVGGVLEFFSFHFCHPNSLSSWLSRIALIIL